MAKAVITIIDKEDGSIGVTIEFTPSVKRDSDGTLAQRAALIALEAIQLAGQAD